ncbi:MAG TPA: hypothetical protein VGD45_23770 [Steroidobacter sp.]|uniref:hypothetical protein n=1 Tax=Steroidobacter sp. TaxID=1978227 RepID=UPI002ED843CF
MKRATALASLISCLLGLQSAAASEVIGLVNFTAGTPARAAEVNGNFNAVKTAVDDNHARIGTLQSGATALEGRVTELENTGGDVVGQLMYGDGSAGDLVVSGVVDWTSVTAPTNLSFNNCTIQNGATLVVSAGTTLRCAGTFTNNGSILVQVGTRGGLINLIAAGVTTPAMHSPQPGDMVHVPSMPAVDADGTFTATLLGASGAFAAAKPYILGNLSGLRIGGGAGSGNSNGTGGSGGGLLRVLVNGALSNSGIIDADAAGGAGGGGGGIVILASRTSIANSGEISARGGDGFASNGTAGACGGGGGGIVVLAAPSVADSGTVDVTGGAAGVVAGPVSSTFARVGGGGGGGSGGAGGNGGNVNVATPTSASDGTNGYVLTLQQDPLFIVH